MHENRETSVASAQGRPVREGEKPQAGHARQGGVGLRRSTGEAAEQRGATPRRRLWREGRRPRRTTQQPNTSPTQSGERVSQGLGGVRQAARERKQERFTALLHHLTVDLLRESYYALKRKAAPGVDGVTWQRV